MNRIFHLILLCLITNFAYAQYNMTFVGNYNPGIAVNDVWGYVANNGTEYALLGTQTGVSVISLLDPTAPAEVAFLEGPSSSWRDLKTYQNYGYVTNESDGGLFVMDLTNPLGTIDTTFYQPEIMIDSFAYTLKKAHNLYIDESGYCYVTGSNVNGGGMLIFDLNANPTNPPLVGIGPRVYSHDVFVKNNIMYTSDIYNGVFTLYDVSDKANIIYLGSHDTPFLFTHNAWVSDDGNTLFTTDEKANAPVGVYDVSDPANIVKTDEVRPMASVGTGTIPHNVHVLDDFVVTSYYTDGLVVFDGSKPDNVVEVGSYDSWPGDDGGFSGVWGAYPFLPSGLVLSSDRSTGLYVLEPTYTRACYLEGLVTDFDSGAPLKDIAVRILNTPVNILTPVDGEYKTGHGTAGNYMVEFSHPGYEDQTLSVNLISGQVTTLDVALVSLGTFKLKGTVKDSDTQLGIDSAEVLIFNNDSRYELPTGQGGGFDIPFFVGDFYDIYGGAWGYKTTYTEEESIELGVPLIVELEAGYEDVFELDLGWTVEGTATIGHWERGVPIGTYLNSIPVNPDKDVTTDVGVSCYVTGNMAGQAADFDVDGGFTRLTSPVFDLTGDNEPIVAYTTWYFRGGPSPTDDRMEVEISNGLTSVILETITDGNSGWRPASFMNVKNVITPTANMTISFTVYDEGNDDLVEGGVDRFYTYDANPPLAINPIVKDNFNLEVAPNPTSTSFYVDFELEEWTKTSTLKLYNNLGQLLESQELSGKEGQITIGAAAPAGIYFLQIETSESRSQPYKVVKTR